jgi:hypothetical protein
MKGKKVDTGRIESVLNKFLEDEQHLVFGFEKQKDRITHRLFQKKLTDYSLFNPYFGINGAIISGDFFPKGQRSFSCSGLVKFGHIQNLPNLHRSSVKVLLQYQ